MTQAEIRRELRPGDLATIVEHHAHLYAREYGVDSTFEEHVAASVARAVQRGFPRDTEAIWIVERDGRHSGSLALTDEAEGEACARWFVLDEELRGEGLGRGLLRELIGKARELGFTRITLETFSELRAAAHLYREHGFEVVEAEVGPRWGRSEITYQRYELSLPPESSPAPRGRKPLAEPIA